MLALTLVVLSVLAADAERGRSIYASNCLACHGRHGDGKGPAALAMRPPATDFTAEAWWNGKTDAQVAALIANGRRGTPMVAFPKLAPDELADLVAYLRTLAVEGGR
jgi:mono/diheme cytochrome c family protein